MGTATLSSRAIIGAYFARLEQVVGMEWIPRVTNLFQSDQESESYNWLGQAPQMREWVGKRNAKGFRENGITIANKHFESTLEVAVRDLTRDKTGQIMARINEMADRTNAHWAKLLSTLMINGESTACYDGQFFFDTDHSEGDSGTQSNDLSIDISGLAVTNHGSTTAPSVGEAREVILQSIQAIAGFLDDQGEPMNEGAREFVVMTPVPLYPAFLAAAALPMVDAGDANVIPVSGLRVDVVPNARLTWTAQVATFRADAATAPFIRQQETDVQMKAVAEGSELEFNEDLHRYGVDCWRNVGYGLWQRACLATMT